MVYNICKKEYVKKCAKNGTFALKSWCAMTVGRVCLCTDTHQGHYMREHHHGGGAIRNTIVVSFHLLACSAHIKRQRRMHT